MQTAAQQNIIRFWHALEHLVPFNLRRTLDESKYVCQIDAAEDGQLPWLNPEVQEGCGLRPGGRYRYKMYLGVFGVEEALFTLRSLFKGGQDDLDDVATESTCFAAFKVDNRGRALAGSLELSTLPWAIGYLSGGDLEKKLGEPRWAERFRLYGSFIWRQFAEEVELLEKSHSEVSAVVMDGLLSSMLRNAGWCPADLRPFAFCSIEEEWDQEAKKGNGGTTAGNRSTAAADAEGYPGNVFADAPGDEPGGAPDQSPQEAEPGILNSFFIEELERVFRALEAGDAGAALLSYLGGRTPTERTNLLDYGRLEKWVGPGLMPPGRWPSEDIRFQSLMQQAAVNLALHELREGGLFSVNGPPGTGKTTMLRDVIAALVVERAQRLAAFADPSQALTYAGKVMITKGLELPIYKPAAQLTGFEVVVASSNNGAVRNVTEEIPAGKAVHKKYRKPAAYFEPVAGNVFAPDREGLGPWGMVAAVLGNSGNRYAFTQKFWFDKPEEEGDSRPIGLRHYLSTKPASGAGEWHKAKSDFFSAREKVLRLLKQREAWAEAAARREPLIEECRAAEARAGEAREQALRAEQERLRLEGEVAEAKESWEECLRDVEAVERSKPSWVFFLLSRLFNVAGVNQYLRRSEEAQLARERASELLKKRKGELAEARRHVDVCRAGERKAAEELRSAEARRDANEATYQEGKLALGPAMGDREWWRRGEREVQLTAPWLDADLNGARADLFVAAVRLHQAFVEGARKKVIANLDLWSDLTAGKIMGASDDRYAQYLWQTLFLVVPVVSTTFASFGRMFRHLGRESIGWLLVDEAGQSTPQAAAGAVWRAKRALVVGDPLQIEPVFPVDDAAVDRIREHHGVAAEWRPPGSSRAGASAQTLADRANAYGGWLGGGRDSLWVGCPLRVHRRCASPMFDISNEVAYGGLMIQASEEVPAGPESVLGVSAWIDVRGECEGKHYVPEQGLEVIGMLRRATEAAGRLPELYVISPFKNVARRLREDMRKSFRGWRLAGDEWDLRRWLNRSVGTVHTFQGKESDFVILVLGADRRSESAARWAAGKPNILNVAATRAKKGLYVVGDRELWGRLKHFEVARSTLPVKASGKQSADDLTS
jgi:hypothetical protein